LKKKLVNCSKKSEEGRLLSAFGRMEGFVDGEVEKAVAKLMMPPSQPTR
jgi:hypothetical protein